MRTYHHLTLEEREKLYGWRNLGISLRECARRLGRHHTTLSREWHRHTRYGREYLPCRAHHQAVKVAQRQRYHAPLKNPTVFLYVREKLREGLSPETIAGRLPLEQPEESLHHETIYRYIYNSQKTRGMRLWQYLTLHRKRRMRKNGRKVKEYGRLETALPITVRPEVVNERRRPGDWESDNMEGKKTDKTSLSVTVERLARITRLVKLVNHSAVIKTQAVVSRMEREDLQFRKTLTLDRGPENSDHERITYAMGMPVFACNPYHSWEKGTVENTIGRIRRYIPKGLSLDTIPDTYFALLEEKLNNTPRKCLGFLTPYEKMREILKMKDNS